MTTRPESLSDLDQRTAFIGRHIGPTEDEQRSMLDHIGYDSLDALMNAAVPGGIRTEAAIALPGATTELDALARLRARADRNIVATSLIGMGYYNTFTPGVIVRRILESPAWYTAYTPYQPEISQGRLEALLNFQTMVSDLCGLDMANASMLDEGTAAAEAMTLARPPPPPPSTRRVATRSSSTATAIPRPSTSSRRGPSRLGSRSSWVTRCAISSRPSRTGVSCSTRALQETSTRSKR